MPIIGTIGENVNANIENTPLPVSGNLSLSNGLRNAQRVALTSTISYVVPAGKVAYITFHDRSVGDSYSTGVVVHENSLGSSSALVMVGGGAICSPNLGGMEIVVFDT